MNKYKIYSKKNNNGKLNDVDSADGYIKN